MAQFVCKTQPNGSAQGRPNVYVACHPDDRERYFEALADDILRTHNCAVYCGAQDAPAESMAQELSEMQLFAVPVTRRLMQQPNRAFSEEIPFALQHRIPVLPVLEESGLEERFRLRFGEMPFLDPNTDASDYREKLRRYLDSVLVSDELLGRIRAEFDGRILLSCRRADRAYAQTLMRRIHEIDFCRDVAILCNDFLAPEEDSSRSVGEMTDSADMFALIVTPGLVAAPNPVTQVEYPAALKRGKPIVALEAQPTDRAALARCCPGLGEPVRFDDTDALRQRLWDGFADIFAEKQPSAEHDYYIGLAYLRGVDVEVDQNRAVKLITDAANAGCYEAACRMVDMYRNGEGVESDYKKSAFMQARATRILENRCRENPTEANTRRLMEAQRRCGTAFFEAKDFRDAEKAFVKFYRICRRYRGLHSAELLNREVVIALYMLGDVRRALYDFEAAQRCYDKALTLCGKLIESYHKKPDYLILSLCCDRLGDIARERNLPDTAEEYYRRALELDERFSTPRNCAVSLDKLGSVAEQRGSLALAGERYAQSMNIREDLAQSGSPLSLSDLAHSHELLGGIARRSHRAADAEQHYRKALELRGRVAQSTESPEAKEALANCRTLLGDLTLQSGKTGDARDSYEKSAALLQPLVKETGIPSARLSLSHVLEKQGVLALESGDTEQAQRHFERCLSICEGLSRSTKTVQTLSRTADALMRMGEVRLATGDLSAAEMYCHRARKLMEDLDTKSGSVATRLALVQCFELLGNIEMKRGSHNKAEYHFHKAFGLISDLDSEVELPDVKLKLMGVYERLGTAAYAKNNPSAAWRYYDEAAKLAAALSKGGQGAAFQSDSFRKLRHFQIDLAGLFQKLGQDAMNARNFTKAELLFQNAADTASGIDDDADRSAVCGNCLYELALAKAASGDDTQALGCLMQSASHRGEAQRLRPGSGALFKLAQCYEAAADIYLRRGEFDSAEQHLQEALRLTQQIDAEYGEDWARKNAVNLNVKRGAGMLQKGDLTGAIERYVAAVNLRAALADASGTSDCRRVLCDCYREAAIRFMREGKPQNAQAYYRAAVNTYEVLVREQNLLADRRALAACHELLGEAYRQSRSRSDAKKSYREAIALRRRLFNETKDKADRDALAATEKAARRA